MFSFRDEFGQWDPKNQRPEIWSLYNGRVHLGQSIRVFPLSNWTELDVWTYIAGEEIEIPELYLAAEREVVERGGMLYAVNEFTPLRDGDTGRTLRVRYRTIGDANLTAAVESDADTVEKIVAEIAAVRITERGATRGDDKVSETVDGRPQEGGLLLMPDGPSPVRDRRVGRRRQEHAHRAAALRLRSRCSATSWTPWSASAATAATTTRTSRSSPTACAPSASRASPSTSPTATSRRRAGKFIIADTPGHIQYTRNMVTGASTADVALILLDARKGITEQSRRHAFIATLLGVPHVVVCVNKMDLVDFAEDRVRGASARSSPSSRRACASGT